MSGPDIVERCYLIRKQGSWYRPNAKGYTSSAIQAGRYTLAEAERHTHPNGKDGPRDGMDYLHEDDVADPDWQAYRAQAATITALQAEVAALREALATYAGPVDDTWNEKPFPYWANGYPGGVFIADNTLDFGETARAALERTKP